MFDVVVAADLDWGIGKAQGLPWPRLRGDLAHFRKVTQGTRTEGAHNAIVMGRKTWESKEVGGKPLKGRVNIVLSRGIVTVPEGVHLAHTLDEALEVSGVENIFVVGGAGVFVEAFAHPQLRHVYLTRVLDRFGCDVVMPDLDARGFVRDPSWEGEAIGEDNGVRYRIERLRRP